MTEKKYYNLVKKEKIFYSFLVIVWVTALLCKLSTNFYNIYWIWLIAFSVIYLYLKNVFTGLKWSQRLEKPNEKKNLSVMNEKEYQNLISTYPLVSATERDG